MKLKRCIDVAILPRVAWTKSSRIANRVYRFIDSRNATSQQLISLTLALLLILPTSPAARAADSTGSPSLAGSIVAQSSPAIGVWEVDLQLANTGSGAAQNITLNTLQ